MKHWKPFIILLLATTCIRVSAQEKFVTLTGKVSDSDTQQPIPFVNIQLKKAGSGTATNVAGEFIFKVPEAGLTDTLVFSCIGYKAVKTPLTLAGKHVAIQLEPAIVELATVTVNARTGLDIIKAAVARIPENYDTSDVQLTAFYREEVWLDDFELAFTEAVVDVYKRFRAEKQLNDQIRIIKGRKKKIDYGREGQLYYWMSGASNGVRGSLAEDMIKYHRAKYSPFNPANHRFYEYDYVQTIKEGSRNVVVLDIVPKPKARKAIMRMRVFLDEESLAIIRYNFELSEQGIRLVSRRDKGLGYAIMSTIVHATTDYHQFQYTVLYNQHDHKWYLNRVTRHWEILVDSKKRNWEDKLWRADMDLIITDINTGKVKPITEGDIGKNEGPIHALVGNDFDEAFWEHYNILKPVRNDSMANMTMEFATEDTAPVKKIANKASNREHGFTRADTLRGKLTPLRTCYDVTFYHLDVAIDMDNRSLRGSNLIRFKTEQPFKQMQIDLYENMKIDTILYRGAPLSYTREHNAVFIDFPEMMRAGEQSEIKVYYQGVPKVPDWSIPMNGGVLWDKDSLGNAWAQVVCQGSGASLWWPNKDHQSDEPDSMKIWITVPAEYTEISNGRLIRKAPQPHGQMRYEWRVTYPINNYNVTFNIGKYAHFNDLYISDDTLTIDYYVMPYNLEKAKRLFRQVVPMLKTFEKYFGKYPFPRDGFTLVESPYPMEHQSGVCIGKIEHGMILEATPLIWHESAHEWWGNAITTKDIADMWIHEAFATYAETLVIEDWFGKEAATLAMIEQGDAVIGEEPVTGVYDVNHIYYEIGDMYSKGSLILHTFRSVLNNDTVWVKLLRDIQQHFRYQTISSEQLIEFINQQTRTDYTYLFDQYLHYTEIPTLQVQLKEKGEHLQVKYRWQADVKNFRMPVKVTTSAGKFGFIYPEQEWKTIVLNDISRSGFEVDEERFYINTEIE